MASNDKSSSSIIHPTPESPQMLSDNTRAYLEQLNSYAEVHDKPGITKQPATKRPWWNAPIVVLLIALVFMVGMVSFGFGASSISNASSNSPAASNSSSSSNTNAIPASVPNSPYQYGGLPAKYVIDPDGAKHFTLTAEQVKWYPVKGGQPVLAWSINGMVPAPQIEVTAGDRVRVTFINHFPTASAIHWHGLMLPMNQDGVPGVGMKPVQPGQTYVYDFFVHDADSGTHWYHSHYNDMVQVPGGFYGAFIVDPRPGTPQYQQQIKADVTYTEFISEMGSYYVINGKSFPDTQTIAVKHGQTVHIRLIGASEMMHPMHLHGHTFNIVAEDGHMLAQPIQKDTLQIAPGETYDLTFYAWAAPGSIYPFHCHILSHLMNPGQTGDEMGGLIILIEYAK
ncbi:MAG: multicopper oxidase domain-containing protein [Ktedonobacteraceae bacterium]|nr:multicopper oxidase domain-containing protein [Ktedonobacteraceae bacterium]